MIQERSVFWNKFAVCGLSVFYGWHVSIRPILFQHSLTDAEGDTCKIRAIKFQIVSEYSLWQQNNTKSKVIHNIRISQKIYNFQRQCSNKTPFWCYSSGNKLIFIQMNVFTFQFYWITIMIPKWEFHQIFYFKKISKLITNKEKNTIENARVS